MLRYGVVVGTVDMVSLATLRRPGGLVETERKSTLFVLDTFQRDAIKVDNWVRRKFSSLKHEDPGPTVWYLDLVVSGD